MNRYPGFSDPYITGQILRLDEQIAECSRSGRWSEIAPLWSEREQWRKHFEIERGIRYTFYLLAAWWERVPPAMEAWQDRREKLATGFYVQRLGHRGLWKQRKADRPKCGYPTKAGGSFQAPCVFGKSYCRLHGGNAGPKTAEGWERIAEAQRVRWSRSPMPKQIDFDGSGDGQEAWFDGLCGGAGDS